MSQNPAGWLRRAIEENYTLPKTSERHRRRSGREKKQVQRIQAKSRAQHTPEEKSQPAQNVATTLGQCPQNVATHNKENKEIEKTDQRENQATWNKALEQVKKDLPLGETEARLVGTTLIEVTGTVARIGVANPFAIAWLERRLYSQIAKAMKAIVGKDLDLQFIACS